MNLNKDAIIEDRITRLVDEVVNGQHKIDVLYNASLALSEERQVEYFSHTRSNMETDIAYVIMNNDQNSEDIHFLKGLMSDGK